MSFFSASVSILLLILSVSSPYVHGNSSSQAVDCSGVIMNMASCLTFVTTGSKVEKPDGSCCSGLKKVLDSNAQCLCEGLKNSGSMGFTVNVTKAATLPLACKLNAPPVSACGFPAAGPGSASAPGPSPSQGNLVSSPIPISGLSLVISGVLVLLFSRI
ncbi:unnamed protein product [Cochlearia groenlandica]